MTGSIAHSAARPTERRSLPSGARIARRTLAFRRALAIVLATLAALGSLGLLRVRARGRPQFFAARADGIARRWAWRLRRQMGLRVEVDGELPDEPVVVVANHLSYVDIVALWCVLPGAFVARADVAHWPLVGIASRWIGTISIDRSRKRDLLRVLPELSHTMAAGRNVIFFPEATSSPGESVLRFRSALFEVAARRDVPVVAVSLQYETAPPAPPAGWSVAWWGGMTFGPHVLALLAVPAIEARLRISPPIEPSKNRKELCRLARESVVKTFIPTAPMGFTTSAAGDPRLARAVPRA